MLHPAACCRGIRARTVSLKTLSAAEQASTHWRIMLDSGVVVPQRHALRAAAFPACLVGEAIRVAVTDADRQLLQHHAHRHHPTSTARAQRYPQCGSRHQINDPRHAECTANRQGALPTGRRGPRRSGLRGFLTTNGIQTAEQLHAQRARPDRRPRPEGSTAHPPTALDYLTPATLSPVRFGYPVDRPQCAPVLLIRFPARWSCRVGR